MTLIPGLRSGGVASSQPRTHPPSGSEASPSPGSRASSSSDILSGRLLSAVDYDQPHDEWVLVLAGEAVLEVNGVRFDLTDGDWVRLPAHVPHRLVKTAPGTSWLALHLPEIDGGAPPSAP